MVVGPAPVGMTRDDEPRVVGMDAGRRVGGRCKHRPVFVGIVVGVVVIAWVIVSVVVWVIVIMLLIAVMTG